MADNTSQRNDLRLTGSIQYKFNNHISADVKYQYESQSSISRNIYDQQSYTARNLINLYTQTGNGLVTYGIPKGGIIDISNDYLISQSGRGQLNYANNWNAKHDIIVIAGGEIRQSLSTSNNSRAYGYSDDILTHGEVNYVDDLQTYDNLAGSSKIIDPADFSEGVFTFYFLLYKCRLYIPKALLCFGKCKKRRL